MVCKHKSEWSYDVDKIKQDTKAYFEKIKNHFKQEYEPQKGKTGAENENLSKHLDKLLESVLLKAKALYFWDEQFAKKTGLPADGVVWHFEPFASVEQMKRVFDVLDKNTIYITRKWEKWTGENESSATYGTFVFDDITGFVCEPYGHETTERNKDKRIPVGTYDLKWHTSSNYPKNKYTSQSAFGKKWKLNFPVLEYGVVCVYNEKVSADRGILIHAGQDGGWTVGCILPSKILNMNVDKRNINLKNSVETLYEILDKIKEKRIENVKLVIKDEIN